VTKEPNVPASQASPDGSRESAAGRSQIKAVTLVVLLVYMAQMTLNPVVAPLARELGLAEWQIGLMISTAAVMVVATSRGWGRRAQAHGARRVLLRAVSVAACATLGFVLTSWAGMAGLIGSTVLFVLIVALRGVAFGGAIAAGIGAAQGMAMVFGSVLGGALAGLGLLLALWAVPVLLTLALLVVLRLRPEPVGEAIREPSPVNPLDPRVWPFLVAGFGMFTALGFVQVLTGFLIQDRFGLGSEATGLVTGGALLAAGVGMILAQAVIVPRSGWAPATLLRVGSAGALAGFMLLIPSAGMATLIAAIALVGLGLGIATPGYTAGPSLLMRPEEQGGLAGTIGMNNGLTFVLAPSASTFAYGVSPTLPLVVSAAIMAAVMVFVLLHPRFGRVPADAGRLGS
jgi:MFS family permease